MCCNIMIIIVLLFFVILLSSLNTKNDVIKYNYHIDVILRLLNSSNSSNINLYFINLDHSQARKIQFLNQFYNISNISVTRISADSPVTMPTIIGNFDNIDNVLACTSSHLKAIHSAFHNNDSYAIIAEDDAIILNNIDWHFLIQLAPPDWGIIQLHTCCMPNESEIFNPIYQFYRTNTLFLKTNLMTPSTACYIINFNTMKLLLSRYVPNYLNPNWNDIDIIDLSFSKNSSASDVIIYLQSNRYVCTQILIDVQGTDSILHEEHLDLQNITKNYIISHY